MFGEEREAFGSECAAARPYHLEKWRLIDKNCDASSGAASGGRQFRLPMQALHVMEELANSLSLTADPGKPLCKGGPLDALAPSWGPEHLIGRAWLMMGGKGAMDFGGHFAVFVDVGGHSLYTDSGGEKQIPHVFVGILVQLGLLAKEDGTTLRIACPIIACFDGLKHLFDPGTYHLRSSYHPFHSAMLALRMSWCLEMALFHFGTVLCLSRALHYAHRFASCNLKFNALTILPSHFAKTTKNSAMRTHHPSRASMQECWRRSHTVRLGEGYFWCCERLLRRNGEASGWRRCKRRQVAEGDQR